MDDQLDKDLSRRIQEVFENFEDISADDGWLKLREKFPEERKRRGLVWLWPAAALLLLFLGLGLMKIVDKQKPENNLANSKPVKKNPSIQNLKDSASTQRSVSTATQTLVQSGSSIQQQSPSQNTSTGIARKRKFGADAGNVAKNQPSQASAKTNAIIAQRNNPVIIGYGKPANKVQAQNRNNTTTANSMLPQNIAAGQTSPLLVKADTAKKIKANINPVVEQLIAASKPNTVAKDTPSSPVVDKVKKPSNIDELFAADQGKAPEKPEPDNDRKVKFGVYAAAYINYAKNGNNQVNAGGGFTAAIPLNKNLKLVTGASINQNSFSYNNQGGLFAAAAPAVYYAASNEKFANVAATSVNYTQGASLLGIDVPLNLQYQFNTHKNPVYILGGLSSGTFINESYNLLYSNGSSSQVQSYKGLNDFYFARTLNLGFGVGYPVGRSQIVIEPFLKYPLYGMGAQQLKFGASGVNLKFNLPTKK